MFGVHIYINLLGCIYLYITGVIHVWTQLWTFILYPSFLLFSLCFVSFVFVCVPSCPVLSPSRVLACTTSVRNDVKLLCLSVYIIIIYILYIYRACSCMYVHIYIVVLD